MPAKNEDLHGSVPDTSSVALLLIDVVNDLEFPGAEELIKHALPMAENIAALKRRAKTAGIPVIYVNDNFGKWQSDLSKLVSHCLEDGVRGEPMVRRLLPEDDDYFVLKPKHSAFYSTTLDTLLAYLKCKKVILTGVAGNICILFTANDAYMRDFDIVVPRDCVASNFPRDNEQALKLMETVLKVEVRHSTEIEFERLAHARESVRSG
jgi:nicotinamidase-related amidase